MISKHVHDATDRVLLVLRDARHYMPVHGKAALVEEMDKILTEERKRCAMNQLEAMRQTISLMEDMLRHLPAADRASIESMPESLRPEHLREMLQRVEANDNPQGEQGFSEAKVGRWLGWMQAAVVAMRFAGLEQMKEINKAAQTDPTP
jgi:hypothetical protein